MSETNKSWECENWDAWKERYGEEKLERVEVSSRIEIMPSRIGIPTARVVSPKGRMVFLHSSVDPIREAQRMAGSVDAEAGAVITVYGFGLGYLVEALLETKDSNIPLFVVEPDRELFCAAMKARDLRHIISSGRVFILVGDSASDVRSAFAQFYDLARYKRVKFTGLPGHQTVYDEFDTKTCESIRDAVNTREIQLRTMIKIGPDVMSSSILNLPDYHTHPGIKTMFGRFTDIPAIIVSAGPSLNKNIELLKEAKGKAVILAVGTAGKALQKWGIVPDFYVSIDPGIPNYEHFKVLKTDNSCLITELQSHHQILKDFQGPMFVSGYAPILQWCGETIEEKGMTESGGSVANNAMSAAYKMGANPIIMVGQDLAYARDGRTHAEGTNYEKDLVNRDLNRGYIYVKANDGGELLTDAGFYQFLSWFEIWIKNHPDREYINATEGGAYIEGTKIMTLREVLDQYCTKSIDIQSVIDELQCSFKAPDLGPLVGKLNWMKSKITETITEARIAVKHLRQLEKACNSKQANKIKQHMTAVRKIYTKFSEDDLIVALPDWYAKKEVHDVMSRTHEAEYTEKDDYNAAIADYHIYYEKIREAAEWVEGLLETCIQEAERRMEHGR